MRVTAIALSLCFLVVACSGDDEGTNGPPANQTGRTCANVDACYPGLDRSTLKGSVVCLTDLQNGYCTHTCTADADCCAASGECSRKEVCSPVQSAEQTYCVLSCETADLPAGADANAFCKQFANPTFTCRSTGGGSNNRKFCGP